MNHVPLVSRLRLGNPACSLIAAAAWLAAVLTAVAAGGAQLELRAECRPKGAVVTLADVAGVLTNDSTEAEVLGAVELFPAPPPGQRRFVRLREVQDLLLLRGINLAEHRFSGSSKVAIFGESGSDDETDGRPVTDAGRKGSPGEAAKTPQPEVIVVAARSLARRKVVQAADVRLEPTTSAEAGREAYRAIDEVLGKEVVRAIDAGSAVTARSVRAPVLVRRGEVVSVFVRSPGVRVRTAARARDEGSLGDLIAVESFEDRKTFLAQVSGLQQVEVYARATRSAPAESDFTLAPPETSTGR